MKRYFYINVNNLNWDVIHPRHIRALRILGHIFDIHNGFPVSEIRDRRLMAVLKEKNIRKIMVFTLHNFGFSIKKICKLTGLKWYQVISNIKAASKNSETVNDYMFLKYAIFELWL